MLRFSIALIVLGLMAVVSPSAKAELLSITDGMSTFNYDPDNGGAVVLTNPTDGDRVAQMEWALRYFDPSQPGTVSRTLASQGNANTGGAFIHNTSTSNGDNGFTTVNVDWVEENLPTNTVHELFDIRFDYVVSTGVFNTPTLNYQVTITNKTNTTQNNLSFVNYVDYDIRGFAGDAGGLGVDAEGREGFRQEDQASGVFHYHTFDSWDRYEIRAWAGGNNIIDNFTTGTTYNLSNSGSPFGPGDMTGGFQWDFSLAAGESRTIIGYIGVPEPGTVGMLTVLSAAGGIAFVVQRRRKRAKTS